MKVTVCVKLSSFWSGAERQSATIPPTVFGGGSIQLARVFGIRIGVDPSWFLILFVIIWSLSGYYGDIFPGEESKSYLLAAASGMLFFLCILLHELGHAVVAKRNGIGIIGIDLWALGGVAKMERDTDSPGVEFRVAAAGPLVTLVIAGAGFAALLLIAGAGEALDAGSFELQSSESSGSEEVLAVVGYLTFINAALLVFNLIPAFPLDGGRIARSIAWRLTGDRTRATRLAARLGRGFSYLMVGAGIFLVFQDQVFSGIWLAVVGVFLGGAARSAELQTELTSRIEGLRVSDVMDAQPVAVPAELPLDRAFDEFFLRYGYPWFPVVDAEGRLVGLVAREAVEGITEAARGGRTVASVMAADPEGDHSGLRVGTEEPLEGMLGLDGLTRLGAIMAVDPDGRLRGIVTIDQVRKELAPGPAVQQ
ncbi:MAG: site-2 protease family protein [Thermoleophilaceae bacterium]